jgi:GT2 family glycosyltransferase
VDALEDIPAGRAPAAGDRWTRAEALTGPEPLVDIVTPVYNGEAYLAETIESVLGQRYRNWRYVVSDNVSNDESVAIAERYARDEPRMRVVTHEEFLPQMGNWNRALGHVGPDARYCKLLCADDVLHPAFLAETVAVAEANPAVGLVSSLRLWGERVTGDGFIPFGTAAVPGAMAGQQALSRRGTINTVFGEASTVLMRADLVRARAVPYDAVHPHFDTDLCIRLLRDGDLGFVHQVLSFSRVHAGTVTSADRLLNTQGPGHLAVILDQGPHFMGEGEYRAQLDERGRRYAWYLARATARRRPWTVPRWSAYHRGMLDHLVAGYTGTGAQRGLRALRRARALARLWPRPA